MSEPFGTYLRRLMTERGLTLQALGQAAGVHYSLIARVAAGQRRPTVAFIRKVAPVLGVSEAELLLRAGYVDEIAASADARALAPFVEYARTSEGRAEISERLEPALRRVNPADAKGKLSALVHGVRELAARFAAETTPAHVRLLIGGALLYFIAAIDAVPDFMPGVGLLDDAAIVALVWKLVHDVTGADPGRPARRRRP